MPPKSSTSGKDKLIEDDEEVLQAVVLADSFNKRFKPLTSRKPRCLLPVCNAPLLDWTFESLALAGVQEVFVICRSHSDQVKEAIKSSKWSRASSGVKIVPIMIAKDSFSPGDAMRDIYTRGLLTGDFVLVTGDLVSNIRIDEVVRTHKERRKTNKDVIMTMVVKESGVKHRTRSTGESAVYVLDAETQECLFYEPVSGYPRKDVVQIPREILASHPEVEIRNDFIDCSIDVCSVEVPSLFQDNFDYSDIRRDFVHGVLTSDLLMKNIHCYIAKEGYAARVKDTKSYESVSKDILSRWTFPLVPDDNHPGGHSYEHLRGNRYIAKDNTVILARTCNIGNNTLIGSSSRIGENTRIVASVIGRDCVIGTGTTINHSYIFEGTTIGAGCTIERSIIGFRADIRDRSKVPRGCLIGDGVLIGPGVTLQEFDRLSKRRGLDSETASTQGDDTASEAETIETEVSDITGDDEYESAVEEPPVDGVSEDSDLEEVEAAYDAAPRQLGQGSNAVVWPRGPPISEDSDEEEGIESYKNLRFMRLGDDALDLDVSDQGSSSEDESETSDEESDEFDNLGTRSSASSTTSLPLTLPSIDLPSSNLMAESEFRTEVTQSLERAFAEGHSVDNAAVELKTLRMASNVPLARVREAVVAALVERIEIVDTGLAAQRQEITGVVNRWGPLIDSIGGVDAVETISALQAHCAVSTRMPLFGQILAALYQSDIVDEDDIRVWHGLLASKGYDRKPGTETDNFQKAWKVGQQMIAQFDEQESEEEESDSEGSVE